MIESNEDIWNYWGKKGHIVVITTNNEGDSRGFLIMGKSIALEAKNRIPNLPKQMSPYVGARYLTVNWPKDGVLCLQTKYLWRDKSPMELVQDSIQRLGEIALRDEETVLHTVRPACGNGGRDWEKEIKPLCQEWPNNIVVHHV